MSITKAENDIGKEGEGLTYILLGEEKVSLLELSDQFGDILFRGYQDCWPLTKILDIGGPPVKPSWDLEGEEIPPIPAHVHSGDVQVRSQPFTQF
jgi:hypothetical protein